MMHQRKVFLFLCKLTIFAAKLKTPKKSKSTESSTTDVVNSNATSNDKMETDVPENQTKPENAQNSSQEHGDDAEPVTPTKAKKSTTNFSRQLTTLESRSTPKKTEQFEPTFSEPLKFAGVTMRKYVYSAGAKGGVFISEDPTPTEGFLVYASEWFPPLVDEKKPADRWIVGCSKTIYDKTKKKHESRKVHDVFHGLNNIKEGNVYCHCCKSAYAPRLLCSTCNRSACYRCIKKHELGDLDKLIYTLDEWSCSHCRKCCPLSSGCKDRERKELTPHKQENKTKERRRGGKREKSRKRKFVESDGDNEDEESDVEDFELLDDEVSYL
jgi:hypothetical protein